VIAVWMANEQLVALAHFPSKRMRNSDVWDDHTTLGRHQLNSLNSSVSSSGKVLSTSVFVPTSSDNLMAIDDNVSDDGDDDNDTRLVSGILARARSMLFNGSREFSVGVQHDVDHDVEHDVESQQVGQPSSAYPKHRNAFRMAMERHRFIFLLTRQHRRDRDMHQSPIIYATPPTPAETHTQIPITSTLPVLSDRIDVGAYGALQHLKFSPDGKYLASTRYECPTQISICFIYDHPV
jgi:hypothetical protein